MSIRPVIPKAPEQIKIHYGDNQTVELPILEGTDGLKMIDIQ